MLNVPAVTQTIDIADFVSRYLAVWNEPDPHVRRSAVRALWSADGVQLLDNTQVDGLDAIEARISQAHEEFVTRGGFEFRSADDAVGHHDLIRFTTCMVPAGGGAAAWVGAVVAVIGPDGLIRRDYQLTLPSAPAVSLESHTRAVVEEYLRRRPEGPDRMAELFAENVDWRVSWPVDEHPVVPWIRRRTTRADVAEHFRTFQRTCDSDAAEVSIDQILIDGSDAVLIGTSSQRVRTTGRRFRMTFALRLTVENGRVSRHHMYEDSLAVVQAFDEVGSL